MVGSENDLILDCYRLARWYHVSPDIFLSMPFSEVQMHLRRTSEIANLQHQDDEE